MRATIRGLILFSSLIISGPALAQGYPTKTVRMIVTFAPGGPTDVIGRIIAQKASESFGQQVVVENVAGGGGNIGVAAALRAPADGYTVAVVSTGFIVNPSLYAKVPYAVSDFAPVSLVAASPNILTVNPEVKAKSVKELVELIKSSPGKFSYAQPGIGSTPHLAGELFKLHFGLDLAMVPFPSAAPAVTAVMAGHTQVGFTALPPAIANVQDGKLRGLAIMATKRNPGVPDVPTMAEAGVPDQESDTVTGIVMRAGTPPEMIARWHKEIVRIVALPEVNAQLRKLGFDPVANSPAEFAGRIKSEGAKWDKVIKDAKIRID
ncbi:MAG: tripartite tricarboxylate transporter substrate binding protein [Xanthobacteraceae bacterium]|nr:tripartite tricarboxylate transporter substrate binding protein [Xanthobacteraceae bacterium]